MVGNPWSLASASGVMAPPARAGLDSGARAATLPAIRGRGWLLAAILALGAALRVSRLWEPGLHPDEALYASWALRIADGSDPALLGVFVDKPPLHLYLLAGLFRLLGVAPDVAIDPERLVPFARIPALAAGLLSVALVYAVAARINQRSAGSSPFVPLLAAVLLAVSPLAVRLSPTLFPDSLLVLWMLLGMWAALDRRAWLTGLACGLAYATKQQALLLIPLVIATLWLAGAAGSLPGGRSQRRQSLRGLLNGFLLVFVAVLWWDSLRWQWMPSYWDRSLTTYGGFSLASLAGLPQRAWEWAELLAFSAGSPLLIAMLPFALTLLGWHAWRGRWSPRARFDLLLLAFLVVYLATHLAGSFSPWDRYALPLVPVLALLMAHAVGICGRLLADGACVAFGSTRTGQSALPALLIALTLLPAAWLAIAGPSPVGSARAYDGVPAAARLIRQRYGDDVVVHQRWLGWHYGFYLHGLEVDQPWWSTPEDLAANAAASVATGRPQLLAFPAGRDQVAAREALRAVGLNLQPELAARRADGSLSLTLYSLQPGPGMDHDGS